MNLDPGKSCKKDNLRVGEEQGRKKVGFLVVEEDSLLDGVPWWSRRPHPGNYWSRKKREKTECIRRAVLLHEGGRERCVFPKKKKEKNGAVKRGERKNRKGVFLRSVGLRRRRRCRPIRGQKRREDGEGGVIGGSGGGGGISTKLHVGALTLVSPFFLFFFSIYDTLCRIRRRQHVSRGVKG